jgi:hypothetical protein
MVRIEQAIAFYGNTFDFHSDRNILLISINSEIYQITSKTEEICLFSTI